MQKSNVEYPLDMEEDPAAGGFFKTRRSKLLKPNSLITMKRISYIKANRLQEITHVITQG